MNTKQRELNIEKAKEAHTKKELKSGKDAAQLTLNEIENQTKLLHAEQYTDQMSNDFQASYEAQLNSLQATKVQATDELNISKGNLKAHDKGKK